jgi:hypothetical protein
MRMDAKNQKTGHTLSLSRSRRWINDLLHCARKVPSIPVQRHMNLSAVVAARAQWPQHPSWVAIFAKAYSRVCAEMPVLRRAYMTWPWPHLYEHPCSIATVAIERQHNDEDAVFFIHLRTPDRQTLPALDNHLRYYRQTPLWNVSAFRMALRFTMLPRPLRRFCWWWGLNGYGPRRASKFGTFGISVYSGLGAESLHPISPLTTLLSYGNISPQGDVTVRLIYDHRVMDGSTIARALVRLDEVLNTEILEELKHPIVLDPQGRKAS